jgi:hypothetical protein
LGSVLPFTIICVVIGVSSPFSDYL